MVYWNHDIWVLMKMKNHESTNPPTHEKWLQLWDDNPLRVVKNLEFLWPGVSVHWAMESKVRIYKLKNKFMYMEMIKFLGE